MNEVAGEVICWQEEETFTNFCERLFSVLGMRRLKAHLDDVRIDLGGRHVNSGQILELFSIAAHQETLVRALVGQVVEPDRTLTINGPIRSGQVVTHHQAVLILGDVNIGARVLSRDDIMVLGTASGELVTTNLQAQVTAARFLEAQVSIGEASGQVSCPRQARVEARGSQLIVKED